MQNYPKIMGILNITPDSFYDGGKYKSLEDVEAQIRKMIEDGALIIDVGGFSSRPGSVLPSVEEELNRIIPVLDILEKYEVDVSVDTCRSKIVETILSYKNLRYINDISGLQDEKILDLIAGKNIGYVLMHIKGTTENMQEFPIGKEYIMSELDSFFEERLRLIKSKGIKEIILDPGFGFGKTLEANYEILKNMKKLKKFGYPLLVGLSRKSMLYKFLDTKPAKVLPETVALGLQALLSGASILRVHDVKEHVNVLKISKLIN